MNIDAMAVITVLVFAEKTLPWGRPVVRVTSAAHVAYGVVNSAFNRLVVRHVHKTNPDRGLAWPRRPRLDNLKGLETTVLAEANTDIGPGGMPEMTGKVTPLPSDQPELYPFLFETGMAGKWELILGAKVQGETDTVSGAITFDRRHDMPYQGTGEDGRDKPPIRVVVISSV
jgi:hypothetical protein